MSKVLRALLLSTVATGAFAVALHYTRKRSGPRPPALPAAAAPPQSLQVEADTLPEAQREALLRELEEQL